MEPRRAKPGREAPAAAPPPAAAALGASGVCACKACVLGSCVWAVHEGSSSTSVSGSSGRLLIKSCRGGIFPLIGWPGVIRSMSTTPSSTAGCRSRQAGDGRRWGCRLCRGVHTQHCSCFMCVVRAGSGAGPVMTRPCWCGGCEVCVVCDLVMWCVCAKRKGTETATALLVHGCCHGAGMSIMLLQTPCRLCRCGRFAQPHVTPITRLYPTVW